MLTPPLLLSVAPAIICNGVNTLVTMRYPANTSGLPCDTAVHPVSGSPTLAKGFPFTKTVSLPLEIEAEWGLQGGLPGPGFKCGVLPSPCLAAAILLIKTSPLPAEMVYPLQCGIP